MSRLDYEVDGREAHRYEFGPANFLRAEVYDGYFLLAWSSSLTIAGILERIKPLLPDPAGHRGVIFDELAREHREMDAADAIATLRAGGTRYSFARLELAGITVVWEQAVSRKDPTSPAEFGFMARVFDEELCARIVRDTATSTISGRADTLIGQVAFVADHIDRGQLGTAAAAG